MRYSKILKSIVLITFLLIFSKNAFSQLYNASTYPTLSPLLLNNGGVWYGYLQYNPPTSTRCQLAFGYYASSTSRYAHWMTSRHHSQNRALNGLDFYLWQPGDGQDQLGTNHVMSITGYGLAVGYNVWSVPTGYIMKVSGNVQIDGNLECEKVEVKNISADFVFDESYKIPTLFEVEQYIKLNKHLPGVPPANVTSEGTDLGELAQILLQKIEELTLYSIEQEKKIEEMQEQLNNLINN